jgi:hypothetical protein
VMGSASSVSAPAPMCVFSTSLLPKGLPPLPGSVLRPCALGWVSE